MLAVADLRKMLNQPIEVCINFHSDREPGFAEKTKQKLAQQHITITTTQGHDSEKGNPKAERTNRKGREAQRAQILEATGRRMLYTELKGESIEHGLFLDNFKPEAGDRSPIEKAGNPYVDITEHVNSFGSKCFFKLPPKVTHKDDVRKLTGIYLGESKDTKDAKKVAAVDYDEVTQQWIIGPTQHVTGVRVIEGDFILRTKPHKQMTAQQLEQELDQVFNTEPAVYEIDKIHDKRVKYGEEEYKVSWKGYAKSHKTWEPKRNLTDFGAIEALLEYELLLKSRKNNPQVKYINLSESERAVQHLKQKYNLGGTIEEHIAKCGSN